MRDTHTIQRNYLLLCEGEERTTSSSSDYLAGPAVHLTIRKAFEAILHSGNDAGAIDFLSTMPSEQRTALLSIPNAVREMSYNGHAPAVIELIKSLNHEQQAAVLSAEGTIWGLAENEHAAELLELIQAMSTRNQVAVLSSPSRGSSVLDKARPRRDKTNPYARSSGGPQSTGDRKACQFHPI